MIKILIADDEVKYIHLLQDLFEDEGFTVVSATDGQEAYDLYCQHHDIDLLILDIMMPKLNGYEVCKMIRSESNVPILMLTALSEHDNELQGLLTGANDYVRKPFHIDVLLARVKNLLKDQLQDQIVLDDLVIHRQSMTVDQSNEPVNLTPKEYALLIHLLDNRNICLSRDQILDRVWGSDYFGDPRTVDTHIKSLRMKLNKVGQRILTKRGSGYMMEVSKDEIH